MRQKTTFVLLGILGMLGILNVLHSSTNLFSSQNTFQFAENAVFSESAALDRSGLGESMLDESYDVQVGDLLSADIVHADVKVETTSGKTARIQIFLDGRDMEKARSFYKELDFRVRQSDHEVQVSSRNPRFFNNSWKNRGGAHITVVATIPKSFNADIATSHGNVDLSDMEGKITLQTSHGDVNGQRLAGPLLQIRTSHGDVDIRALEGNDVSVLTSHADISIGVVHAQKFDAETSHADILIKELDARADITNSHGDIEVMIVTPKDTYLKTRHGDVDISLPSEVHADLNLKGQRVRVGSGYEFSGQIEKDHAVGSINGGGPRVEARTSYGTISLRTH